MNALRMYKKYFLYVFRHKWFVFLECVKLGIIWRGIVHDNSKFLPSEAIAYANYFSSPNSTSNGGFHDPKQSLEYFNVAWLKHQHRNPHHWQHWILVQDDEAPVVLPMPEVCRKEMLADWIGAGKAQGHGNDLKEWYGKHKDQMKLHPDTRNWIEQRIQERE